MYYLLALIAGALVITCISVNGRLAKEVGLVQGGITNFAVGLIAAFIYYLIANGFSFTGFFDVESSIPVYYFLGGAIGSCIMLLNSLIINKLPAVYVTILIFLGQLATGMVIDYFVGNPVSIGSIIGGVIIVIGLYVYIKGDKKVNLKSQEDTNIEATM